MGIVIVNTTISLDGFIAGRNDEMDWVFDNHFLPDEPVDAIDEVIGTTGAILTGRRTYDAGDTSERPETSELFGGRWSGPQFVLTHRPHTEQEDGHVTFLSSTIGEAVSTAVKGAKNKNVLVLGANVVQQCLNQNLVDELLLLVMPIVLGDGISLFGPLDGQFKFQTASVTQAGQTAILRLRR